MLGLCQGEWEIFWHVLRQCTAQAGLAGVMAQPSLPKRFGTPLELSGEDRGSDPSRWPGMRERDRDHLKPCSRQCIQFIQVCKPSDFCALHTLQHNSHVLSRNNQMESNENYLTEAHHSIRHGLDDVKLVSLKLNILILLSCFCCIRLRSILHECIPTSKQSDYTYP